MEGRGGSPRTGLCVREPEFPCGVPRGRRVAGCERPHAEIRTRADKRDDVMSIRIVLADDHAIVRHGLSRAIQQEDDMEVVGQASDGHTTVDLAREVAPDIVVMDISMPDLNGIEATREIQREAPGVK